MKIQIILPDSLHQTLRQLAEKEGVSMNQVIVQALAEKIAALQTESYLQERAQRGDRDKFKATLEKVADVPVQNPEDQLD